MKKQEKYLGRMPAVKKFINEYRTAWWVIGIFILITYGIKVFNVSISHDTEVIIAGPKSLYGSWYTMGRFGLIFLKKILGTYVFNPYAAAVLMAVSMLLNGMLWTYLLVWISGEKKKGSLIWIFPVFFFTSMIMAEQSGFLLQAYEVNVALLMVGAALLCLFQIFVGNGNKILFIPAVACSVIAFSTYQSLVPLFTAGVGICFIVLYDRLIREQRACVTFKFCFTLIGKLIAVFLFSFLLYQVSNKIVLSVLEMETTSYVTDQIMWGTLPVQKCIYNILRHIYRAVFGKGLFYNGMNLIVYCGSLLYILGRCRKKEPCYMIYILAVLYCLGSPFLMSVLMGNEPTARTQLVLPFVVGFFLQYLAEKLWETKKEMVKYAAQIALIGVVFAVMHQSLLSARLYYTQYVQYEEDVQLAAKISEQIEQLGGDELPNLPVVFVGARAPQQNPSCIPSGSLELIGRSFFEVSFSTEHGTWVMRNFFVTLGHSYLLPTADESERAEIAAKDMPSWPASGSIALKDDMIIVKLSE